jgi:hypothetical protein
MIETRGNKTAIDSHHVGQEWNHEPYGTISRWKEVVSMIALIIQVFVFSAVVLLMYTVMSMDHE